MSSKIVNVRLSQATLIRVDTLVEKGLYSTRSAMIRSALERTLGEDLLLIGPLKELERLASEFDDKYLPLDGKPEEFRPLVDEIDELGHRLSFNKDFDQHIKLAESKSDLLLIARAELKRLGYYGETRAPSIEEEVMEIEQLYDQNRIETEVKKALDVLLSEVEVLEQRKVSEAGD